MGQGTGTSRGCAVVATQAVVLLVAGTLLKHSQQQATLASSGFHMRANTWVDASSQCSEVDASTQCSANMHRGGAASARRTLSVSFPRFCCGCCLGVGDWRSMAAFAARACCSLAAFSLAAFSLAAAFSFAAAALPLAASLALGSSFTSGLGSCNACSTRSEERNDVLVRMFECEGA